MISKREEVIADAYCEPLFFFEVVRGDRNSRQKTYLFSPAASVSNCSLASGQAVRVQLTVPSLHPSSTKSQLSYLRSLSPLCLQRPISNIRTPVSTGVSSHLHPHTITTHTSFTALMQSLDHSNVLIQLAWKPPSRSHHMLVSRHQHSHLLSYDLECRRWKLCYVWLLRSKVLLMACHYKYFHTKYKLLFDW